MAKLPTIDEFVKTVVEKTLDEFEYEGKTIREWVELIKVNAAPVAHGRWLDREWDDQWQSMTATCSHCLTRGEVRVRTEYGVEKIINSPCCPHCGAKMDAK